MIAGSSLAVSMTASPGLDDEAAQRELTPNKAMLEFDATAHVSNSSGFRVFSASLVVNKTRYEMKLHSSLTALGSWAS